jgi:hypothetical protein
MEMHTSEQLSTLVADVRIAQSAFGGALPQRQFPRLTLPPMASITRFLSSISRPIRDCVIPIAYHTYCQKQMLHEVGRMRWKRRQSWAAIATSSWWCRALMSRCLPHPAPKPSNLLTQPTLRTHFCDNPNCDLFGWYYYY